MPEEATVAAGGEDRISALPDEFLHHVLFFLPSYDVVRTCVISRRWRHLWRSTRALRITRSPHDSWRPWTVNSFGNSFLFLRGCAPLDELEVACGEIHSGFGGICTGNDDEDVERERSVELSRRGVVR
nr:unnamed protein product [Digitaria exilis]